MCVAYDAILVVSFGGPEKRDDVLPFLENVLRGRNVPRERMLEVAEHYYHFGGVSPINAQTAGIDRRCARNWRPRDRAADLLGQPQLASAAGRHLRTMQADGVRRALAWVTSAYGSYSGCRQYWRTSRRPARRSAPPLPKSTSCGCSSITRGFIDAVGASG